MILSFKNTVTVVSILATLLLIFFLKTVVAYLLVSVVFALIGRPIMKVLDRPKIKGKSLPVVLKSGLTLTILLSMFFGLFSLFTPLVVEEIRIISSIDYESVLEELNEPINDLDVFLKKQHLLNSSTSVKNELSTLVKLTDIKTIFNSAIGILGNSLIAFFSIMFITFFFLKDKDIINNFVITITPKKNIDQIQNALKNVKRLLSRYFIGIILQISIITILVSIGLSFLGIKNAILIGLLAGIINVIPYIGPLIGGVLGIAIGISTNLELDFYTQMIPLIIKISIVFGIMQLIDNFILQPIIFSNSVKAHPLEIFLVILSAGTIWGISGMVIAIPFYTFLRVIAKEFLYEFKVIQELTKNI